MTPPAAARSAASAFPDAGRDTRPAHFFTVDVEEYFQAFPGLVPPDRWDGYPSRLALGLDPLLDALARAGARGTVFTLGWIARKHPDVVRQIAAAGHEVASHGYWHQRVVDLTPAEFRADVRDAKAALEDVAGTEVMGYRAPLFSILPGYEWAFDVLLEEGYRYDSSRFPGRRPDLAGPPIPRVPHDVERAAGRLLELPMATTTVFGKLLPAAGGNYLRQFPYGVIERAFQELADLGAPTMFYIHPRELDAGQPRLHRSPIMRFRHYGGIARVLPRIERLLARFAFTSVAAHYGDQLARYGRAA
jgi:polysaccharide deacetylase family protein (PEP-CTERM system associated)